MSDPSPLTCEAFLFTRNQRRDFVAFVRPRGMTNKEVSLIANAFHYVNDVTPLTAAFPGLYCFPLGAYTYVLRHYDSGRTHAGREIPVIEGIAVARGAEAALPVIVREQATWLNTAALVGDIETLEAPIHHEREAPEAVPPDEAELPDLIRDFVTEYVTSQLMLPFNEAGRDDLIQALDSLPGLTFAFGSNRDVAQKLEESGFELDILGYLTTREAELRPRALPKVVEGTDILPPEQVSNWPETILPPKPSPAAEPEFLDDLDVIRQEREQRRAVPVQRGLLRRLFGFLVGR